MKTFSKPLCTRSPYPVRAINLRWKILHFRLEKSSFAIGNNFVTPLAVLVIKIGLTAFLLLGVISPSLAQQNNANHTSIRITNDAVVRSNAPESKLFYVKSESIGIFKKNSQLQLLDIKIVQNGVNHEKWLKVRGIDSRTNTTKEGWIYGEKIK